MYFTHFIEYENVFTKGSLIIDTVQSIDTIFIDTVYIHLFRYYSTEVRCAYYLIYIKKTKNKQRDLVMCPIYTYIYP